jgi:hypothetical protein
MIFANGKDTPLNQRAGTVPDVSGALTDWFQPMTFIRVTKSTVGFQLVETPSPYSFQGVIQPFSTQRLLMKPEGQRAWKWFLLHAEPGCTLKPDEVVTYLGASTRIMGRKDFTLYGYVEYELVQDYTGAGP